MAKSAFGCIEIDDIATKNNLHRRETRRTTQTSHWHSHYLGGLKPMIIPQEMAGTSEDGHQRKLLSLARSPFGYTNADGTLPTMILNIEEIILHIVH